MAVVKATLHSVNVIGYRYIYTLAQPCCTSRLLWRCGRVSDCHPGDPGSIPVRVRSEDIFLHLSHLVPNVGNISLYVSNLLSIDFCFSTKICPVLFGHIAGRCFLLEDKSWHAVPSILRHCLLVVCTVGIMRSEFF